MEENYNSNPVSQTTKEDLPEGKPALTYGILGNALGFLFFIPYVGIFSSLLAIIFSILAITKGKAGLYTFKGKGDIYTQGSFVKSLVGMILGIGGIAAGIVFFLESLLFTFLINTPHHYSHHYYY
jgi:hypothetical protein